METRIPKVVNVHKVKGVRPHYTLYAGRHVKNTEFTEDSRWHNPFYVGEWGDRAIPMYRVYLKTLLCRTVNMDIAPGHELLSKDEKKAVQAALYRYCRRWDDYPDIDDLTGQEIACWCHPEPCHVDVMIEFWKEKRQEG